MNPPMAIKKIRPTRSGCNSLAWRLFSASSGNTGGVKNNLLFAETAFQFTSASHATASDGEHPFSGGSGKPLPGAGFIHPFFQNPPAIKRSGPPRNMKRRIGIRARRIISAGNNSIIHGDLRQTTDARRPGCGSIRLGLSRSRSLIGDPAAIPGGTRFPNRIFFMPSEQLSRLAGCVKAGREKCFSHALFPSMTISRLHPDAVE